MTAGPQTGPPPHAPAGGGPRPCGVPASAGQHTRLTGRSTGHPTMAPFQHLGLAMGGHKGSYPWASRRLGSGEAKDITPSPGSWTRTLCRQRPTPSATSASSWGHAGFLLCQPVSCGNVILHAERCPLTALRCPVSGRGGGNHHCAPTLCARRFSPLPSPEKRGRKKGPVQALLSDLRRAGSEWQLGLLHAV